MMGQIMNQGVAPPPSRYQPSNFGFRTNSSFSCESNSQRNPNFGEPSNISERHTQNNGSITKMGEGKIEDLKEYCTFFTTCGRSVNNIFRHSHWKSLAKYVFCNISKIFKSIPVKRILF